MGFIKRLFNKQIEEETTEAVEKPVSENMQPNKVDVNKPVENPRLKYFLKEYAQQRTNDSLNNVLEEIAMNAHFLSVIALPEELESEGTETVTLKKDMLLQFPMLRGQEGQSFFPVFTDWVELGKWEGINSPKTLILSFDDYAAMVLRDEKTQGIVVNPFSDNLVLSSKMIEHIKTRKDIKVKGISEQVITKETKVHLGEPKNYPTEMVSAISDYSKMVATVNRVWLRLMEKDKEQSYLLVVDFSGDRKQIFNGIGDAARPYLKTMYLDIVPYEDGFGKNAVNNVKPFFQT